MESRWPRKPKKANILSWTLKIRVRSDEIQSEELTLSAYGTMCTKKGESKAEESKPGQNTS